MTSACLECATYARVLGLLVGRIQKRADTDRYPLTGLLALSQADLLSAVGVTGGFARDLQKRARDMAAVDVTPRGDAGSVCTHDRENYPERLRDLGADHPRALFYTGPFERFRELTSDEGRQVAIVGTRRPSAEGAYFAEELGATLARSGVTVISGMAFGIDRAAHTGACSTGRPALVVLGSGADNPTPKANSALYERLVATGTAVSEMPWGQKPAPWTFPARNRIMAALAYMTVVVEAAEQSGSLITATCAENLGRTLAVVPGSVRSEMSRGTNRLLRDTPAAVVRGAADVLDDLYGAGGAERLLTAADEPSDPISAAILRAIRRGSALEDVRLRQGIEPRELRTRLARLEGDGWIRPVGLGGYAAVGGRTPEPSLGGEDEET
jgi:DNA processing protein